MSIFGFGKNTSQASQMPQTITRNTNRKCLPIKACRINPTSGNKLLLDLDKMSQTDGVLDLRKNVISLDKVVLILDKENNWNLYNMQAKVAIILDWSGSMKLLYQNGSVQKVLNILFPIGMIVDDNQEADVWIFYITCLYPIFLTISSSDIG